MIDLCIVCDEPADWGVPYELPCGDLVHEHCREDYEQNQAERAYESFCEDFYGGSGPCTVQEQHEAAWKQKRELDGF